MTDQIQKIGRSFGLVLKRIKGVKDQIDLHSSIDKISKSPLLDFFTLVDMQTRISIKLIVFESGEANILPQIDINKLLNKLLTKKEVKADYLRYSEIPKSPLITQIEESLSAYDIQSIIIKVKDKEYIIGEEFFLMIELKKIL